MSADPADTVDGVFLRAAAERARLETIEECARVAESYGGHNVPLIAAAIRALKDKPCTGI